MENGYSIYTNIKNIDVSGKYCLSGATITSNFTNSTRFNNRTLNLKINGLQNNFTLICSAGDTCIVQCLSKGSCSKIDFYCHGICVIHDGRGM